MVDQVSAPVVAPAVVVPAVPPVVAVSVQPEFAPAVPPVEASSTAVSTPNGTVVERPDWMKSFSPENQEEILKANWKQPDELVKSYNELRAKLTEKGAIEPGINATPAEWNAYYEARGAPKLASEYQFALPKDIPPNMPYDATFADNFKNWAKETGLTKAQAAVLHDKYVSQMVNQVKSNIEAINNKVTTTHAELVKAWGSPETEAYRKNVEMATRAIQNLEPGLNAALKSNGLLSADGTVLDPSIAKALAKAGQRLYAEDQLYGAGQQISEKNPWAKGSENLTAQGEIYKSDPERANALRRAAGLAGAI